MEVDVCACVCVYLFETICMSICVRVMRATSTLQRSISCYLLDLLLSYKVNTLSLKVRASTVHINTRTHTRTVTHTHTHICTHIFSCVCYTAAKIKLLNRFLMLRYMKTKCTGELRGGRFKGVGGGAGWRWWWFR